MKYFYYMSLYVVVFFHMLLVITNLLSFLILPFSGLPWYVVIPVMSWIFALTTNRAFAQCKITQLENYFRKKVGMREIKSFVGNYMFSPLRKLYRRIKLRT